MKAFPTLTAAVVITLALTGPRAAALAQLDPVWLKRWTTAQTERPAEIPNMAEIAPESEPGSGLFVRGRVFEPDGTTPARGVIVFAYQTGRDGLYARPGASDPWRLKGWARTDDDGRFGFRTIRPGTYPSRSEPAHIHLTLESPRYGRQLGPALVFEDDPLVSERMTRESEQASPFGAVMRLTRDPDTGWLAVHPRIRLKSEPDF